jgi:hypothetical protein
MLRILVPNPKTMSGLLALHWVFPIIYLFTCFAFLGTIFVLSQYFLLLSWGKFFADIWWEWQKKHVKRLLFCFGNSKPLSLRSGLLLPYMLRLDIISFLHKQKIGFLFFPLIAFQILHIFLSDISVHCALLEYAYIWLRVYVWYLLSFLVHLNAI